MKNSISLGLLSLAFIALTAFTFGFDTVKIQTTAVCGMCKDRIESTLSAIDGIESARLDMTTKIVKVKFDTEKQSEASIKAIISKIGYGAGDVEADTAAFDSLPGCCKSSDSCKDMKGEGHSGEH